MLQLFRLIHEDLRAHREGIFAQGFWALACHRLSHPRLRCNIPIIRQLWYIINRVGGKFIELITGIALPEGVKVGRRLEIEHFGGIVIHAFAEIGDDCMIRQGVTIGNRGRSDPHAPKIGNRVEIGAGAVIVGPITIGDDSVVGANAVVTRDVPPWHVAVGVPAQLRLRKDSPGALSSEEL